MTAKIWDRPLTGLRTVLPGLLLCGLIAVAALCVRLIPGLGAFSPLIYSILLGMAFRNTLGVAAEMGAGMRFALRHLLRLGIVVLGLQLTIGQIAMIGWQGLASITFCVSGTFLFTIWAGKVLNVEPKLTNLIATGTSICGASAILAANSVTRAHDEDVAYAIACVTLFGTLAMLLFPLVGANLPVRLYGLWAGTAIHEVAQAVAAGVQRGPESMAFATIAKLTRVAMLAPLILLMIVLMRGGNDQQRGRAPFPWFVLGFIAMAGLASSGFVPSTVIKSSPLVAQFLLSLGLAAMGLHTDVSRILAKGLRPLALGAVASIFLSALALLLVLLSIRL